MSVNESASSGSLSAVRLIAEEITKDDAALSEKFEPILPHVALRVDAGMTGLVSAAAKIASKCKRNKRICMRDVERAVRMEFQGQEAPIFFVSEQSKTLATFEPSLVCFQEPDIDLKAYVDERQAPLPRAPIAPTFAIHWLAVDGVQPTIAENETSALADEGGDALTQQKKRNATTAGGPAASASQHEDDSATMTRELALYLDKVTTNLVKAEGLVGGDAAIHDKARHALACLVTDAGIDRLVPHFVRFVMNHTNLHLKQLPALWTGVKMAKALVENDNLHNIDLYLHELLPPLLTCVVGKALCEGPEENHWSLREEAAIVIALICKKYGEANADLQPRVIDIYHEAVSGMDKPLTTQYGGIVGLAALGPYVVNHVLLPLLRKGQYLDKLEATSGHGLNMNDAEFERSFEAFKVLHMIRDVLTRGPGPIVVDRFSVLTRLGYEWTLFNQEATVFI